MRSALIQEAEAVGHPDLEVVELLGLQVLPQGVVPEQVGLLHHVDPGVVVGVGEVGVQLALLRKRRMAPGLIADLVAELAVV